LSDGVEEHFVPFSMRFRAWHFAPFSTRFRA
jgi:hypothetical protein